MNVRIEPSWLQMLQEEFNKPYFASLARNIKRTYQTHTVYPKAKHIFRAFDLSPFTKTKVVILGQDPYHGAGQADGLAFSVPDNVFFPPSLQNILKELENDLKIPIPSSGSLERWAIQGVLLLNSILTVEANKAGSHQSQGWETFTDRVIELLSMHKPHIVFILWGSYARQKEKLIDTSKHLIIKAAHPSPLSAYRGFFGHKPFSQTNDYLTKVGETAIQW